ncbi:helix-turn-helix domain-containing protein [Aneurinibacillus migulanus]|uniref:helix-turn-helix domain-containing protein n=1 Tax=Aneurinibacillus migulanus TaxID=47500 RepID=UPI00209E0530|nr:helix-turn-helix domain-containing protein [Aneurinibacillus migulanus]MCP1359203.1 helix-turn-helix domain-containing protein [Aneurinibacillus migulanus]
MAKKEQKFKIYSFELKKQAVEMRLQGKTKKQVAELLRIEDIGRLKVWMRTYREQGEFSLLEHRGRRRDYVDQERYARRLEMENAVLKKWLEILNQEV